MRHLSDEMERETIIQGHVLPQSHSPHISFWASVRGAGQGFAPEFGILQETFRSFMPFTNQKQFELTYGKNSSDPSSSMICAYRAATGLQSLV